MTENSKATIFIKPKQNLTLMLLLAVICYGFTWQLTSTSETKSATDNFVSNGQRTPEDWKSYLTKRYGVKDEDIQFTYLKSYPIIILGGDESTLIPKSAKLPQIIDAAIYDVIVIGGGPAGLTAAHYLTDNNFKVLLVERDSKMGGLAQGSELNKIRACTGAAYATGADRDKKVWDIYKHVGLPFSEFREKLRIFEPSDSFFWKGKLYAGIWEEETLEQLPRNFKLFKHAIEQVDVQSNDFDVNTDFGKKLDSMNMQDFVRSMPEYVSAMKDKKSEEIYQEFLHDPNVNAAGPMEDVLTLLNLYSRAALGTTTEQITALGFSDFYISEMSARYAGTFGTGDYTEAVYKKLQEPERNIKMITNAPVSKVINTQEGVEVHYVKDGNVIVSRGTKALFAAPLKLAPALIQDFSEIAPKHNELLEKLEMTNYAVHTVRVKGHPMRATFDLWLGDADNSKLEPSDVIAGRWMDPIINGYEGMRNFENDPSDDFGVLTIYHPLGPTHVGSGFSVEQCKILAEDSVDWLKKNLEPYLKQTWGSQIDVELIETSRWPSSIHVARPGWLHDAKVLKEPVGNIHFGNNNLGLPEFEWGIAFGKGAADEIIEKLRPQKQM